MRGGQRLFRRRSRLVSKIAFVDTASEKAGAVQFRFSVAFLQLVQSDCCLPYGRLFDPVHAPMRDESGCTSKSGDKSEKQLDERPSEISSLVGRFGDQLSSRQCESPSDESRLAVMPWMADSLR